MAGLGKLGCSLNKMKNDLWKQCSNGAQLGVSAGETVEFAAVLNLEVIEDDIALRRSMGKSDDSSVFISHSEIININLF